MHSRRDFCSALPALALLLESAASQAQTQSQMQPAEPHNSRAAGATAAPNLEANPGANLGANLGAETEALRHNQIFRAASLPVHSSANGSSQHVVQGTLVTGEGVELHNSTLLPGHEPHPPHQHVHAEFLLIREGNVEWLLDGKRQSAGPGDILYASSNVLHGLRNTGAATASYFVVAIGPNLKERSV